MSGSDKLLLDLLIPCATARPHQHGACPVSQKWFMLHYLLVQANLIDLRVTPISRDLPPPGFDRLRLGRRLPILLCTKRATNDSSYPGLFEREPIIVCDTEDEREEWLERLAVPGFITSNAYNSLVYDIGHGFKKLLLTGQLVQLGNALKELDAALVRNGTIFLNSNQPGYIDCAMAAKLQHLRVAGAYFRGFRIPSNLIHVWTYLANTYQLEAFQISCPADKDILLHHTDRLFGHDRHELTIQKKRIFQHLSDTYRLFTYPSKIQTSSQASQLQPTRWAPQNTSLRSGQSFRESSNQSASVGLYRCQRVVSLNRHCNTRGFKRMDQSPMGSDRVGDANSSQQSATGSRRRCNYMYRQIPPTRYFAQQNGQ